MKDVIVRPAGIEEAATLSALGDRARASWGAEAAHVAGAPVQITPGEIAEGWVWVAQGAGRKVVGVATLKRTAAPEVIGLDRLYVTSEGEGQGAGEALLGHLARMAKFLGARTLRIEVEPRLAPLCEAAGAVQSGAAPGRDGRPAPVYELKL